jgi:hypothetical protein
LSFLAPGPADESADPGGTPFVDEVASAGRGPADVPSTERSVAGWSTGPRPTFSDALVTR